MMNVAPHTSDIFYPLITTHTFGESACSTQLGPGPAMRAPWRSQQGAHAADSERLLQKPTIESCSHSLVIAFEVECYS